MKNMYIKIKELANKYRSNLKNKLENRIEEMGNDDNSHYLIYKVLGISEKEGELIDIYQNKGRFLYKYAGSFLEEAAFLCFKSKFPSAKKEKIDNLRKDIKQKNKALKKARRENFKKSIIKNLNSDSFIVVAGGIIIILLLSLITFKQSQIADIKYSINKKNTEIHNINNEIKVEKLKIDESSRSDIIEQKAMEELGMIYRRQDQIEYITVD